MEKRVAAPVGLQPAPQVGPTLDLVHRLVLDQLFQHDRRGAPVDPLQHQEAAVEPRVEQVRQVGIDADPMRSLDQLLEHPAAHLEQHGRAAGHRVQAPEKLLAARLHRTLQPDQVGLRRVLAVGVRNPYHILRIGREFLDQQVEEDTEREILEALVRRQRLARQPGAGDVAALRQQRMTQPDRPARIPDRGTRRIARARARDRTEQAPQQGWFGGSVHRRSDSATGVLVPIQLRNQCARRRPAAQGRVVLISRLIALYEKRFSRYTASDSTVPSCRRRSSPVASSPWLVQKDGSLSTDLECGS